MNPNNEVLNRAIKFLVSSRTGYGNFGSTQATILALKAITQYAKFSKRTQEAGTVEIFVNDKKVAKDIMNVAKEGRFYLMGWNNLSLMGYKK
ncbi:MAG: hypothetical protein HC831_19700 [Chloroflexia bacterium]|nr:hypothetical protein [Chloroflexia bacterium]